MPRSVSDPVPASNVVLSEHDADTSQSGRSSRPAARPSAPASQARQHSTTAPTHPQAYPHTGAQTAQGGKPPGLFAQAASTMGGAVAGSVVGHGISNMLFGGRSAEAAPPPPAEYAEQARQATGGCDIPAKGRSRYGHGCGCTPEADDWLQISPSVLKRPMAI